MLRIKLISVFIMALCSSAAIAETTVTHGQQVYLSAGGYGCQVCHGQVGHGAGQVGGYIRGASLDELINSLTSQPEMQLLGDVLSANDVQSLSDYLIALGNTPLVTVVYDQDQWIGQHEELTVGQTVQMVIYNSSFESQSIDLTSLGLDVPTIEPLATQVFTWSVKSIPLSLPQVSTFTLTRPQKPLTLEPL